jgi:hypothetical protein
MDVRRADPFPAPLETTRKWLVEYLCEPHVLLGRAGPVCPFIPPALKAGSVLVAERRFQADTGIAAVVAAVSEMMDGFEEADWPDRDASVRALVWVLTGIPDERFHLLDDAHQATKTEVVGRGFMLGQFHPHRPEAAIRNPQFMVSRAPVPLFGLRQMASSRPGDLPTARLAAGDRAGAADERGGAGRARPRRGGGAGRHRAERLSGVADAQVRVVRDQNGLERLAATVIGGVTEPLVRAHCADLPGNERPNQIECVAEEVALSRYSAHGKLRPTVQ